MRYPGGNNGRLVKPGNLVAEAETGSRMIHKESGEEWPVIIDFRYHLTSLVAVFLALGIGIVIGSLVVGDDFVSRIVYEQESIVKRLEQDYENLKTEARLSREETHDLKRMVEQYRQYTRESFPFLIKDRLAGQKVAVIEQGVFSVPQFLLENLTLSGAEVYRFSETIDTDFTAGDISAVLIITEHTLNKSGLGGESSELSELLSDLEKRGTKIFTVETGPRDRSLEQQGEVYHIASDDSILEQAVLIADIAARSEQRPLQVSGSPDR